MMKSFAAVGTLLILCAGFAMAEQISVAAAADLNSAMKELAAEYQKQSGRSVSISFGASGNLYAQIQSGAPYDVFFSADSEYPQKLAAAGRVEASSLRTYAVGRLVLWVPSTSPLNPEELKMNALRSVRKVAIANPEHAPYGRAAMAALEHYGLQDDVRNKLVFGESVSQAAQFAHSGNAQAALLPESLAVSPAMTAAGKYWVVPTEAYPEIRQEAGIVSSSKEKQAAEAFVEFVTSAQGQAILQKYGFSTPAHK